MCTATFHSIVLPAGPESTHCALRIHNDEHRSPVHLGQAFGHFSCSHPGLRIAKLIEDMQLTGSTFSHAVARCLHLQMSSKHCPSFASGKTCTKHCVLFTSEELQQASSASY